MAGFPQISTKNKKRNEQTARANNAFEKGVMYLKCGI